MHTNIHAKEGVPSDVKFTSATTNDNFMFKPVNYRNGNILAFNWAYVNYEKFKNFTKNEVVYVTKMKKNLVYTIQTDTMYMPPEGKMEYRVQHIIITKHIKQREDIIHKAKIITYVNIKKVRAKLVFLITNNFSMGIKNIVAIYRKR